MATHNNLTDPTVLDSKTICAEYFGVEPMDKAKHLWKCKCGTIRKCDIRVNGYANLKGHIRNKHLEPNEVFVPASKQSATSGIIQGQIPTRQTCLQFLVDPKSKDIYKWIDWIVMDELELSFCEQERTRRYTSLNKTCTKTIKKYMFKLRLAVKQRVRDMVSECHCFALIYDGWTEDNTHFIGMCLPFIICQTFLNM